MMGEEEEQQAIISQKMKKNEEHDHDEEPERGTWSNPCDFFISCLGYAVGLGTIIKFYFTYNIFQQHIYKLCRQYLEVPLSVFQAWRRIISYSLFSDVVSSWSPSVSVGGNKTHSLSPSI